MLKCVPLNNLYKWTRSWPGGLLYMLPGVGISCLSFPLKVINAASNERLLRGVFITLSWCTDVTIASGQFPIEHGLG